MRPDIGIAARRTPMILDSHGRELQRTIGFIGGYVPVRKAQPPVDALYAVGVGVPAEAGEDEEDAAPGSGIQLSELLSLNPQARRAG